MPQSKPYPDFPLTLHRNGQWCKKIRGKIHYFGTDPHQALQQYLAEKDDLYAGRTPNRRGQVTTERLVFAFLDRNETRVEVGDLSSVTLADYVSIAKVIVAGLGRTTDPGRLQPRDFARFRTNVIKRYSVARWSKIITVTRQIFHWGVAAGEIDRLPNFGPDFAVASSKQRRVQRASNGKKLLTRDEIHGLLNAANVKWRAIVFLGINGGLGNSDVARLKLSDVGGEWLDYARGKTGIDRRIPHWPETQAALQAAIDKRPTPMPGAEELLFLSRNGNPLIATVGNGRTDGTVSGFRRLAKRAGIYRPRMGMYWLRHTFQTVGDGARDPVATSAIMGHADSTMAGNYREEIDDERLKAVTDHVHNWLFGGGR